MCIVNFNVDMMENKAGYCQPHSRALDPLATLKKIMNKKITSFASLIQQLQVLLYI